MRSALAMVSLCGHHVPHIQLLKTITVVIAMTLPISANRIDRNINPDGCGEAAPVGRVYNGEAISRESVPWIVEVLGLLGCAGSIITSNVILTAAHCLTQNGKFAAQVYVLFNTTTMASGHTIKAERMMLPRRYIKRGDMSYDVALVKLPIDLKFNRIMKPVCLPEEDIDVAEKTLIIAGWGRTKPAVKSTTLLHAKIVGLPDELCQQLLRIIQNPITKRMVKRGPMVCTMGLSTNVCEGDSGGPLMLKDDEGRTTQVGIASVTVQCGPKLPAMFSRVAFQMKWIKQKLNHPARWRTLRFDRNFHKLAPKAPASVSM